MARYRAALDTQREREDVFALRGENATVVSNDRITFEAAGEGTRITYYAELSLKGPLRVADPLLGLAFNRVGERALPASRTSWPRCRRIG